MTTQTLDQPYVASTALRTVNFFNGRLLTGDDLSREQATQEALRRRLGRATGEGIAFGFEVVEQHALSSKQKPVVTVFAGLAVARSGIALQLDADLDVALYRDAATASAGAEPGNLFADCQLSAPGTYTDGTAPLSCSRSQASTCSRSGRTRSRRAVLRSTASATRTRRAMSRSRRRRSRSA